MAIAGTKQNPWTLKTPPGSSEFQAYRDPAANPPALVVQVGKTELRYNLRCLDDLQKMLHAHGDWMLLGSADEQKPAAEGTVEAWARSTANPIGGWYGLKKGLRGRFAMYVPPVMKAERVRQSGWTEEFLIGMAIQPGQPTFASASIVRVADDSNEIHATSTTGLRDRGTRPGLVRAW